MSSLEKCLLRGSEEDQARGPTVRVSMPMPEEEWSVTNPCQLYPARLPQSPISVLLSGLLVMALTLLWLVFI